jgi:imidazolonepropionase
LLDAAHDFGLATRLHADQIHASGGAELAAEVGALSADHLASVSQEGIEALARAAASPSPTIATLLPLTSFYLADERDAPARALIDAGVPVAIGTDFNPGTSPAPNAQLALAFAVHRLKLTAAEAITAMTINAAAALGIADSHGSLEVGKNADMTIWNVDTHALLPYWLGADLVQTVIKGGRVVYTAWA